MDLCVHIILIIVLCFGMRTLVNLSIGLTLSTLILINGIGYLETHL